MDNFIIACIILVSIFIFTGVNSYIICDTCDDIIALIDSKKEDEAKALWQKKRDYIAIFVRDAEIDVADSEAESLGKGAVLEDGEAEMGALRFREAIIEIRNSEKINLQDIL